MYTFLNVGEAITDPFWDPESTTLAQWNIKDGKEYGLKVSQFWCWLWVEWADRPESGIVLEMQRDYQGMDVSGFDKMVFSAVLPTHSELFVTLETDKGMVSTAFPAHSHRRKEYFLDLDGATTVGRVTLALKSHQGGISNGWFNWIGLENTQLLKRHLASISYFDGHWDSHLVPDTQDFSPAFTPSYGIIISKDDLLSLREQDNFSAMTGPESTLYQQAEKAKTLPPEKMIGDFVKFWEDTRYCRDRDYDKTLLRYGTAAASLGILTKDKELLRLSARYALSLAMCTYWNDGFICEFPGSNFRHMAFVQSLVCHEIATILDLAGEFFTSKGKNFLLRRLAEEGIGKINHTTWKDRYIFRCNQLSWISPGRIYAYGVLEKNMPRVADYTDTAFREITESLNQTILPDGGYAEGPAYFSTVGDNAGTAIYYFSQLRDKDFSAIVPQSVKNTADYAEIIFSTDKDNDFIPICDATAQTGQQQYLANMAVLLPDSQWGRIYRKSTARTGGVPDTLPGYVFDQRIPRQFPPLKPFVSLPDLGIVTSLRTYQQEYVKVLLMGGREGGGHNHEDKGSFVLEFAGQSFAIDPGIGDYGNSNTMLLKQCERHNMLVPFGTVERPAPENKLLRDVLPHGTGDETSFTAGIEAGTAWEHYHYWKRSIDSPKPEQITITDSYSLVLGKGADFLWNTRLPVTATGENSFVVTGEKGIATVTSNAEELIVSEYQGPAGSPITKVALRSYKRDNTLTVSIALSFK